MSDYLHGIDVIGAAVRRVPPVKKPQAKIAPQVPSASAAAPRIAPQPHVTAPPPRAKVAPQMVTSQVKQSLRAKAPPKADVPAQALRSPSTPPKVTEKPTVLKSKTPPKVDPKTKPLTGKKPMSGAQAAALSSAAHRAIAAGNKLARRRAGAGKKLIAAGQRLLKQTQTTVVGSIAVEMLSRTMHAYVSALSDAADLANGLQPLVDQLNGVGKAVLATQGQRIIDQCVSIIDAYNDSFDYSVAASVASQVVNLRSQAQTWQSQAQSLIYDAGATPSGGVPAEDAKGSSAEDFGGGGGGGGSFGGGGGGGGSEGGGGGDEDVDWGDEAQPTSSETGAGVENDLPSGGGAPEYSFEEEAFPEEEEAVNEESEESAEEEASEVPEEALSDLVGALGELIGMFDLAGVQRELNGMKPVTVDIAHTLVKSGMNVITRAIEVAKQADLPGETERKNVKAHLEWHVNNLRKFSDLKTLYPSGDDLKKYVVMAFVDANAVEEGAQYLEDAWQAMKAEINVKLASVRNAVVDAAGDVIQSTTGIPVWAWVTGGVLLVGFAGLIGYKLLTGPAGGVVVGHYLGRR